MARETYMEAQIPTGVESPVYLDARQISRSLGKHLPEAYIGQVTGAGGAGGTLTGCPFEPAVIEIMNEAGATAAWGKYVMLAGGGVGFRIAAATVDTTADVPVVSEVAGPPKTWSILFDTNDIPDTEVATIIVWGVRDVAGGL